LLAFVNADYLVMEKDLFYKGTLRVNVTDQFWIHCRDFKPKPYLKGL